MSEYQARFTKSIAFRQRIGRVFEVLLLMSTMVGVAVLAMLLMDVFRDGAGWLSWRFLVSFPSRFPHKAGIKAAFWGSIWLMGFTALLTFPLGVATAIYLEEYAPQNRLTRIIQTNISNLAGVPAIVYGILGLALFVRGLQLGRSVIAGALTMTLLILPVVIIAAQEAIRAVPRSIRLAAYALGATRWQTVRYQVLPAALPGILTGTILALSRAIGEAAPLVMIGALTFVPFAPRSPLDDFTVLPIQIFNWASRPKAEFHHLSAAAIIVLLAMLLSMNGLAIWLRNRYRIQW
jgi:phosphate transport system permease protein